MIRYIHRGGATLLISAIIRSAKREDDKAFFSSEWGEFLMDAFSVLAKEADYKSTPLHRWSVPR